MALRRAETSRLTVDAIAAVSWSVPLLMLLLLLLPSVDSHCDVVCRKHNSRCYPIDSYRTAVATHSANVFTSLEP